MTEKSIEKIKEMRQQIYAEFFATRRATNDELEVAYDSYTHTTSLLGKPAMAASEFQLLYQHTPNILKQTLLSELEAVSLIKGKSAQTKARQGLESMVADITLGLDQIPLYLKNQRVKVGALYSERKAILQKIRARDEPYTLKFIKGKPESSVLDLQGKLGSQLVFGIKGFPLGFFLKLPVKIRSLLSSITFGISYESGGVDVPSNIVTFKKNVKTNANQFLKPKAWWGYMREWFKYAEAADAGLTPYSYVILDFEDEVANTFKEEVVKSINFSITTCNDIDLVKDFFAKLKQIRKSNYKYKQDLKTFRRRKIKKLKNYDDNLITKIRDHFTM